MMWERLVVANEAMGRAPYEMNVRKSIEARMIVGFKFLQDVERD